MAVVLSYLLGAIPFGLLLGKIAGVDIRAAGSRNIGATNVARLVGKKFGIFTLVLDAMKGAGPMLLAQAYGLPNGIVMLCGGAAFFGHCFSVYLKFTGGKGVATALGVFLFLDAGAVLLSIAAFVGLVKVTGFVAVGSLFAALLMAIVVWLRYGLTDIFYLATFVTILVWLKHHENIKRLFRGEEKSFKKKGGNDD